MTLIEREFVSLVSATGQRNGAGFNTCQGLYHTPQGRAPKMAFIATHYNVDFQRTLPRRFNGCSRRGISGVEYAIPG